MDTDRGAGPPPRFRSEHDGIVTWHCFSAGAHYDPSRLSWGSVIALDEHHVAPGCGFDWHPHRGVHIVSWVLAGTLRHEDSAGEVRTVSGPNLLVQSTGDGVRHRETNASDSIALHMVQLVVLGDAPRGVRLVAPPAVVGDLTVDVVHGPIRTDAATFDVRAGAFHPDGAEIVGAGLLLRRRA